MSDDEFFDYGSDSGNVSPEPDPESDLDDIYDDVIGEEPSTSRRYIHTNFLNLKSFHSVAQW